MILVLYILTIGKDTTQTKINNLTTFKFTIMNYTELTVLSGNSQHPCTCFTVTDRHGLTWYVCEGGTIVNATHEDIQEYTNIETIEDVDCFTFSEPFKTLEQFEEVMQDYI